MRRFRWLVLGTLLSLSSPADADLLDWGEFGFGGFGSVDVPLAQDDAEPGPMFGLRARMGVLPNLALEASTTFVQDRDATTLSGGKLPAPNLAAYSIGAVLRGAKPGINLALSAGLGLTRVAYPGDIGADHDFSWNVGFGVELPLGPVLVDVGPRLLVVQTGGGGSRKHLGLLTGVSFYFD